MTIKNALWRSGVMLLLVGVTVALCNIFPNAAENSEAGMIMRLPPPDGVPGHIGYEQEPSEAEKKWLPSDTGLLKRIYVPEGSTAAEALEDGIAATLILSGNDRRSLHRPQVCLRAQGWHIGRKEVVTLEIGDQELEVMDFWLSRKDPQEDGTVLERRAHYVYWWIGAKTSTPSDFNRILITVLDNMFRNVNNRWGYPSVMAFVDLDGVKTKDDLANAREVTRERIFAFIRNYAPMFQVSLGAQETE